jgi:ornithine cyclodeaminase/alanine dehydrogenase-like protein (mu-crystallin family)
MRYLSAKDLTDLVSPPVLLAATEQGLRDFAEGRTLVTQRQQMELGGVTLLTMPAMGEGAFGVKVVSIAPTNTARDLPVINGLMTLSDGATGVPLAILDAAALTAQRTGAVGALGLKYTTPSDVERLGIIGVGVQGMWQVIFACAVRRIRQVSFIARSDEKAKRFVDAVSRHVPQVSFTRCATGEELLAASQVVITATNSNIPVLPNDAELLENRHFISIGSYKPTMQELPDAVYQLAAEVVVDSDAAGDEVGDLINPIASGVLLKDNVIHLADLVAGKRTIEASRTTVFKSVGLALYDLYAAQAFFAEAQRLNRGTVLN